MAPVNGFLVAILGFLALGVWFVLPPSAIAVVKRSLGVLFLLALAYIATAWWTFEVRHPAAGSGTFWSEFAAWLRFQTVPRFQ